MRYITYPSHLKKFSRQLRKNSTLSEVLLWNELKQSNMMGYKFNRQMGLHFLRFDDHDIKRNLSNVLLAIENFIKDSVLLSTNPPSAARPPPLQGGFYDNLDVNNVIG